MKASKGINKVNEDSLTTPGQTWDTTTTLEGFDDRLHHSLGAIHSLL